MQTVTLSAATTQPATYPFALTGTTATAGTDFTAATPVFSNGVTLSGGVITVPAGVTSFTVTYPTAVDALVEAPAETTALTVGGATGVGTINDPVADLTPVSLGVEFDMGFAVVGILPMAGNTESDLRYLQSLGQGQRTDRRKRRITSAIA